MSELTSHLPGKRSRTRTHAMTVPMTALTATTTSEQLTVSQSAEVACLDEMASQKVLQPSSKAASIRAANGMSTIRLM